MSALTLSKRNMFPTLTNKWFGDGNFLSPRTWDFYSDLFDMDYAMKVPSVNIMENEKDFKFMMAAPGMEKKDFKVSLENDILTISAEKKEEMKNEDENFARREYSFNSFSRSFKLPENCIFDKVDAKYENGVLLLTLPKKVATLTKAIKEIKVA